MNVEFDIILGGLLHSPDFLRAAIPHIKRDFLKHSENQLIFQKIYDYFEKYGKIPTKATLEVELSGSPESAAPEASKKLIELFEPERKKAIQNLEVEWMCEKAEKYCLDRSVYNGIMKSLSIIDGEDKKLSRDSIPSLLEQSLAVSFDADVGHDYLLDFDLRYQKYHENVEKISTGFSMIDGVTGGGFERKTLNLFLAPTGIGKTMKMTYLSAVWLKAGYNVLYVSFEMSEDKIAERVDQAIMKCSSEDLRKYPKDVYAKKLDKLKRDTNGKLFIKEYPTGTANALNVRHLIQDIRKKKGIKIDILVVDYLNISGCSKYKDNSNSYGFNKAIAEEYRAVSVQEDLCCVSATQTNREGQNSSEFSLNEVSESHGISMTVDSMWGCVVTDDLEALGQMRILNLKNRYGPKTPLSWIVGMNREHMSFSDIDIFKKSSSSPRANLAETANSSPQPSNPLNSNKPKTKMDFKF